MANTKITELSAASAVTVDDLVALVDDAAGTPATKKATVQQLLDAGLDSMYAQPLARTKYDPGTTATPSTTSTTFADADSTNLTVTFTAPANGCVVVHLEAHCDIGSGGTQCKWNLRNGSSDVAGTTLSASRATSTGAHRVSADLPVSGLTPGAEYTLKWGIATSSAGVTARLVAGGGFGPAIMEVRSDPLG